MSSGKNDRKKMTEISPLITMINDPGRPTTEYRSKNASQKMDKRTLSNSNKNHTGKSLMWITILNYFWSFMILGLYLNLLGPAMPELMIQTSTPVYKMTHIFMINGILYGIGSILFGLLLEKYPDLNHLLNTIVLVVCELIMVSLIVFVHSYVSLLITCTVYSLFIGGLDTCGNVALMRVIRENTAEQLHYIMQFLQAFFNVGALIIPLIVELSVRIMRMDLYFTYVCLGLISLPPIYVSYFILHRRLVSPSENNNGNNNNDSGSIINDTTDGNGNDDTSINKDSMFYSIRNFALVINASVAMVFSLGLEVGFGAYLTEFVIKFVNDGTATKGRILTFIYFGFGFVSRLSAAFINSYWLSIKTEMIICSIISIINGVILVYFSSQSIYIVGICAAVYGYSITPFFGSLFNLVEMSGVKMSGLPTTFLMIGAGIAASFGPGIIGYFCTLEPRSYDGFEIGGWAMFSKCALMYSFCLGVAIIPLIYLSDCQQSNHSNDDSGNKQTMSVNESSLVII